MSALTSLTYQTTGRIARITLNRPERDEPFGDAGRSTFKGQPRS